jgi:hypothetical protein
MGAIMIFIDIGIFLVVLAALFGMWSHWLDIRALRKDLGNAKNELKEQREIVSVLLEHHKRVGGNGGTGPRPGLQKSG